MTSDEVVDVCKSRLVAPCRLPPSGTSAMHPESSSMSAAETSAKPTDPVVVARLCLTSASAAQNSSSELKPDSITVATTPTHTDEELPDPAVWE
eukprot:3631296-Rhodomonas_salina.5